MADWLDQLEEKKKREQREWDARWESGRAKREGQAAEDKARREHYEPLIKQKFDDIREYVNRARRATGKKIDTKIESTNKLEIGLYHEGTVLPERAIVIDAYLDRFSIDASVPKGLGYVTPYLSALRAFNIPVSSVTQEHISSWVKWVSTGEMPFTYTKDVTFKQTTIDRRRGEENKRLAVMALIAIVVIFFLCKACSMIN